MKFTQYMRPNGEPLAVSIDRGAEIEAAALQLSVAGVRFEAEVLMNDAVSLTAERDDADGEVDVLACEIVANGPGVPDAVDRLVRDALKAQAVKK